MHSHKHNIFSYIAALVVSFFLIGNSITVAYNVSAQLKKDLTNQFYVLNYETGQVIEANSSLLSNLIASLELPLKNETESASQAFNASSLDLELKRIFTELTKNLHYYNDTLIILTDNKYQILSSAGKTASPHQNKINLQDRQYLQTLSDSEDIQIGDIITGAISKTWRIPVAKGIRNGNNDLIGAIIISIPLSQFSKSVFSSHINLSSISLKKEDSAISEKYSISSVITAPMVLKVAFSNPFSIFITEPLSNIEHNASFTLNSQSIRKHFWNEFFSHSLIATSLLVIILLGLYTIRKKVLDPLAKIRQQLLASAQVLQTLIPEYKACDTFNPAHPALPIASGHYADSLAKIENFASANHLIISTLIKQKNLIETKDKQLSLLHRNFISAMKSLQEHSKCISEHIDDIILHNKTLRKEEAAKMLTNTLVQIYNYTTKHTKRIESIEGLIDTAWKSAQTPKMEIDFNSLIETVCIDKVYSLTANKEHSISKVSRKPFYPDAVDSTLQYALEAFEDNSQIAISLTDNAYDISIDITHNIEENATLTPLDNFKLQSAIEKARLFALLDEGVINLHTEQNKIVVSIKYFLN